MFTSCSSGLRSWAGLTLLAIPFAIGSFAIGHGIRGEYVV